MNSSGLPTLAQALRPVPHFERAVREISKMLSAAGIRQALVGALAANAYRHRPRTTEDIDFLVGDEAFETHPGGYVTMRVPVIEFDGIEVEQVPLADVEAIVAAGADRDFLTAAVAGAAPDRVATLQRLFATVDRSRQ